MHKINTEVLNATLKYLSTRPYVEVAQLIEVLAKLEEIKEAVQPKEVEPKPEDK